MEKYKILSVRQEYNANVTWMFAGFRLEGVIGIVDPFVGGGLDVPELKEFEGTGEFHKKQLEWAKSQIGKIMVCEYLVEAAFATAGKVSFQ